MQNEEKKVKNIQSVHRALDILEYLIDTGNGFSLSTIADHCGLNKTTAFHLLKTLENRGYVEQSYDTQFYKPGWKSYDMASSLYNNLTIVQAGRPYMEQLFNEFDETVLICYCGKVQDQVMGTCCWQIESTNPLRTTLPIGTHLPLHCTSQGKVYLTGLSEQMLSDLINRLDMTPYTPNTITDRQILREQIEKIRSDGFCVEREEFQSGVCTVAVPIIKYTGRIIFSLVISMPTQRATDDRINAMIEKMLPMARELSRYPF